MDTQLADLLLLRDHNVRVVALATALLGIACGLVGTFVLLRKRALAGDAMSHATLPGVAGAFLALSALGWKASLAWLLLGGAIAATAAALAIAWLRRRMKEDTATAIVLGGLFGLGIALLGVVQSQPGGAQAGLGSFIYGKAASMTIADLWWLSGGALLAILCSAALFKELRLLCFDEAFAASIGRRTQLLDGFLMALVALVVVVGLQAVGAILVLAMLVLPPAAARYWTGRLGAGLLVASAIGGVSGTVGSLWSAMAPRLPAGAVIVLVAAGIFLFSMFLGTSEGVLVRAIRARRESAWS